MDITDTVLYPTSSEVGPEAEPLRAAADAGE